MMNEQPRRKALVDALGGGGMTPSMPSTLPGDGPMETPPIKEVSPGGSVSLQTGPAPIQRQTWTRANVLDAIDDFAPTREGVDQAIAANPWLGKQVGNQGGKIQDPETGEIWDVVGNLASGRGHHQVLTGHTAKAAGGGGSAAPMPAAGGINPMLGGNAGSNIQSALDGMGAQSQSSLLQQLIRQLGGG